MTAFINLLALRQRRINQKGNIAMLIISKNGLQMPVNDENDAKRSAPCVLIDTTKETYALVTVDERITDSIPLNVVVRDFEIMC